MKLIYQLNILLFSIIVFTSCATQSESSFNSGQTDITEIEDNGWFIKKYEAYHPSQSYINTLKNLPENVKILAFAGMWDNNSKNSLPEFYKIADKANVADDQIVLYLLDKDLKNMNNSLEQFNIEKVPTYIILKDGKEVSRISGLDEPIGEQLVKALSSNEQMSSIK